jgi:leucyl aminopeptidase
MIKLRSERNDLTGIKADIVAVLVLEDESHFKHQVRVLITTLPTLAQQIGASSFRGKELDLLMLYPGKIRTKRLMLVGLGKRQDLSLEKLRRAAATAAKHAQKERATSLALIAPELEVTVPVGPGNRDSSQQQVAQALAEGAALGAYTFDEFISKTEDSESKLKEVSIVSPVASQAKSLEAGIRIARVLTETVYGVRDLENSPGNTVYPNSLAGYASRVGRRYGFRVQVLNERRIKKFGMGGLLGVSQGSDKPPRFIIMEYNRGNRGRGTIVLVGKGVTFDSGGISIKPSANMAEMKMDMSGAAAVIGTMQAAARLKIPLHIVGLVPATENLLSGSALKPGDILRHLNGKTSEIDNTDAEGRLILADALSFASRYKPDVVIDLATLTGACVVALGHIATGMMGTDQSTMDRLKESGERTYERVWQLPMYDEYEKLIKSDVADVKNTGGRWGGAITAAMFLKKFIGNYKWVHLDIAGTAIIEEPSDYIPKGGSGVGVRLLIDFLQHWNRP